MEEIKTKICPKCNIEKDIKDFHKCSTNKSGLQTYCKKCRNKGTREKARNRTEKECYKCKQIKLLDEFYVDNSSIDKHQKRCKICTKLYYKENIEHISEYFSSPKMLEKNRNRQREYRKNYTEEDRIKLNEYTRQYNKTIRKYNLQDKARRLLRARFKYAVKNKIKVGSAIRDLGCTIDEFLIYIEPLWAKDNLMKGDKILPQYIDRAISLGVVT